MMRRSSGMMVLVDFDNASFVPLEGATHSHPPNVHTPTQTSRLTVNTGLQEDERRPHSPRRETPSRSVEELRLEADGRQKVLARVRTYIRATPAPTTPDQRAQTIHAKVVEERAVQVREKAERVRQKEEEEAKWARVVLKNRQQFEEDQRRERHLKTEKKERLRKELDVLCQEREERRAEERARLQRLRQDAESSDQAYLLYHQHLATVAAQEKLRKRDELLNEIEKVKATKLQEALKEEEEREADLRYSAVKRAYARRVKQRILDKMKGKKTYDLEEGNNVKGRRRSDSKT
ncbi:uncharacterized protein [Panulirus ornatus]|uniref:uncharacterized protein n=1 Tax=Panulirus ornatus TaxID=150431 RepID=UPI003A8703B7